MVIIIICEKDIIIIAKFDFIVNEMSEKCSFSNEYDIFLQARQRWCEKESP